MFFRALETANGIPVLHEIYGNALLNIIQAELSLREDVVRFELFIMKLVYVIMMLELEKNILNQVWVKDF